MDHMTAQAGLALLSQPSAGGQGGVGGGSGYKVDMTTTSTAKSSLDSSNSRYELGGGDITLGGLSSQNMSLLIIASWIVAGLFLYRKGR